MSDFTSLGSALNYTGTRIASLTRADTSQLPPKDLKEATSLVNKANNYLKAIKEQAIPEFDQKNVQSILKNIEKIKKKSEVTPHELKPVENKKFIDALSKFSHH